MIFVLLLFFILPYVAAFGFYLNWRCAEADLEMIDKQYDALHEDFLEYRAKYFAVMPFLPVAARKQEEHDQEEREHEAIEGVQCACGCGREFELADGVETEVYAGQFKRWPYFSF